MPQSLEERATAFKPSRRDHVSWRTLTQIRASMKAYLTPLTHTRNPEERVGVCSLCGGPDFRCARCDKPYCEWCEPKAACAQGQTQ